MKKENFAKLIDDKFYPPHSPVETRVTYKNQAVFIGFFHNFNDYKILRNEYKFRFIPKENIFDFKTEMDETGHLNPKHSIIIDCNLIERLELLNFIYKNLF